MSWPNETPPGLLGRYLIGDLGVAHRHVQRLQEGQITVSAAVLHEIQQSIETCIARIERDVIEGGRTS